MSVSGGWFQKKVKDIEVEEWNDAAQTVKNSILSDMEMPCTYTTSFSKNKSRGYNIKANWMAKQEVGGFSSCFGAHQVFLHGGKHLWDGIA
nr:hypothetical protein [Tanacetum cinerariifolium]